MEKKNQLNEEVESTTNDVLRKALYSLSFEEINSNFNKVECQLVRRKYGTGQNVSYRYMAILLFKKGIFEKTINLTQTEYNVIVFKRTGLMVIPDSYKTTIYYLAVKSQRVNPLNPNEKLESYQLKMAFSSEVRKKEWLTTLEVQANEMFNAIKYVDRPELVEADDEQVKNETGF